MFCVAVCRFVLIARCWLRVVCYVLFAIPCVSVVAAGGLLLFVVCWCVCGLLVGVCCWLRAVCCLLSSVCCLLCDACCRVELCVA